jgi:hypothetical protein
MSGTTNHPLRNIMNPCGCVRNKIFHHKTLPLLFNMTLPITRKIRQNECSFMTICLRSMPDGLRGICPLVQQSAQARFISSEFFSPLPSYTSVDSLNLSQHDISVWTGVLLNIWSALSPFYITKVYINFQGNVKFDAYKCKWLKNPRGKKFRTKMAEKADLMVNSTDSWFKPLP